MRMRFLATLATALLICAAVALAQPYSAHKIRNTTLNHKAAAHSDPGERAFQMNCSRCHSAPEQLPASISGTVVRHMRVRANLSAEDEKAILHYLTP